MRIHPWAGFSTAAVILAACGGGNEPNRTPAAIVLVSGNNQTGGAGQPLALPLTVRVNDQSGDPVTGVIVNFAVGTGGGGVLPASATTNDQGRATTTWTMGAAAGAASAATASVSGLNGSPVTFTASVLAGTTTSAALLQGDAQSGDVGQPLPTQIVVEFRDAFGNPTTARAVTWAVTGGAGSIQGASALTDGQGRATASWTLGLQAGAVHSLRAQVATAFATAAATGTLGAGSTLAIASGNGQTGLASQALGAPIGVRVQTATGQNVANVPIAWTVAAGGGLVAQPTTVTGADGIAVVVWTLGAGAGLQTVAGENASLSPSSVTLSATSVVPQPSAISGTVVVVDSQLSAIRAAGRRAAFAAAEPATRGPVRHPAATGIIADELLVRFRETAIGPGVGLRALGTMTAAMAMDQAIRDRLAAHAAAGRVAVTGVSPVIRTARIKVASLSAVDSVARALAQDPAVLSVGPNGRMYVDGGPARPGTIPNDPNFANQSWHYSMIDLPRAWSITQGSPSVIVAVLDNGFVFHHQSLGAVGATYLTGGGNLRNDGYDFVSSSAVSLCAGGSIDNTGDGNGYDPDPSAPDDRDASPTCLGDHAVLGSHGTHVSGTIGAVGNDGVGVTGVNWSVSIRPVRVLGLAFGDYFDIANGVLYAAGFPASGPGSPIAPPAPAARIINMSLGGECPVGADPIQAAVQVVTTAGTLVVASSGNEGTPVPACPAAYPEVLSVGAVGPTGSRASYSNFGTTVDIAAPGGEFAPPADGTWGVLSTVCDFTPLAGNPGALCDPLPHGNFTGNGRYFGTSMAAPHVTGVAALLLSQNPGLTPADLRSRLITYATPIPAGEQIGAGIVNARNALTQTAGPSRQLYARAVSASTGAIAGTVPVAGGTFTISGLPDGGYFVVAGEDEAGDGLIGLPGRRFGALGGIASPAAVTVNSSAGAFAALTIGFPVEEEPNDGAGGASALLVDGAIAGSLSDTDLTDLFRITIPVAGTYTFETTGFAGAFCSYALEVNTTLDLLDSGLGNVAQNLDIDGSASANNFCSRISGSLSPGTYYLRVTRGPFLGTGPPHVGRYILQARAGP